MWRNARTVCLILGAMAGGCGDGSVGPDAEGGAVAGLRALAREAETAGEQGLADALGGAAGAVSNGVVPASLSITLDGAPVQFEALVVGHIQQTAFGALTFRSLVAWTGHSLLEQVLHVRLAADAAPIGSPGPEPDPRLVAGAMLINAKSGQRWLGAQGNGSVKVSGFGTECPWPSALAFPCRMAAFLTEVEATFTPIPSGTGSRSVALGPTAVTGFVYGPSQ